MIRVLLADDHEIFLFALSHLIDADARLEVVGTATSARRAVELAEELRPDVVLLDVVMPGMSGLEAAIELRRRLPQVGVVLMSGIDHDHLAQRAVEVGAHAYLTKAEAVQRLPEVIAEAASRPGPSRGSRHVGVAARAEL